MSSSTEENSTIPDKYDSPDKNLQKIEEGNATSNKTELKQLKDQETESAINASAKIKLPANRTQSSTSMQSHHENNETKQALNTSSVQTSKALALSETAAFKDTARNSSSTATSATQANTSTERATLQVISKPHDKTPCSLFKETEATNRNQFTEDSTPKAKHFMNNNFMSFLILAVIILTNMKMCEDERLQSFLWWNDWKIKKKASQFYISNCFYNFKSVHENYKTNERDESTGINQFKETQGLLTSARFLLYDWMPKSKRKSETIELSQKTSTVKKLNKDTGRPPEHSLHWTEQRDKFVFDSVEKSTLLPVTLRTFLCFIASVLIDFMNLITLYCKLIMQEVRQQKQSRNGQAPFKFVRNVLQTILQLLTAQTTRCSRQENINSKCTSELYFIAHALTAV